MNATADDILQFSATLRVVVWSNYPDDVFENEFKPKLAELGVNVLRTYKPDRVTADAVDASQADVILLFTGFMSHPQQDSIKKKAKTWGKSVVMLERQSSGWPELLAPFMPKVKSFGKFLKAEREDLGASLKHVAAMVKVPLSEARAWEHDERLPTPQQFSRLKFILRRIVHHPAYLAVRSQIPETEDQEDLGPISMGLKSAMNTYRSLVDTKVPEDQVLHALREVWDPDLVSLEELEGLFERHVKTDRALPEFRSWWDARQKAKLAPPPPPSLPPPPPAPPTPEETVQAVENELEKVKAAYETHLKETKDLETMYEEELRKVRHALKTREEELETVKVELSDKKQALGKAEKIQLKLQTMVNAATSQSEALQADLAAAQAELETAKTGRENMRLQLEMAKKNQGGELDKIGSSLKTLFEAGMLSREEIGSKLVAKLLDGKS